MQRLINNYTRSLLQPNKPTYITVYANNICQLRCDFCFYWDAMQKKSQEITVEQAKLLGASVKGLVQLSITGGEPTLRKDLVEFVTALCESSNTAKCSVTTNGFRTQHILDQARKILTQNPEVSFRFCVSIDGTEKVHDKIRGIKNSYKRAVATFKQLKVMQEEFSNLRVDINTCVNFWNYNDFWEFVHIVKQLSPTHHTVTVARGITKEHQATMVPTDVVERVMEYVKGQKPDGVEQLLIARVRDVMYDEIARINRENKHKYNCTAGNRYVTVYQDGRVNSCEILETIHPNQKSLLGDLNNYDWDLQKVLDSVRAEQVRKFIKDKKCFCTFECAKTTDVVYTPRLVKQTIEKILTQ